MKTEDRFSLKDQNIIITGGGGNLGFYHAFAILEKKGNPILIDLDKKKLIQNKDKLFKLFNKKVSIYKVDLTKKTQLIKFFNLQEKNKVMINALINNADINSKFNDLSENLRIENLNLNFWQKHINAGLTGNFLISSLYYIYLCKFNLTGQIINISSDLGIISPDQRLYEDTKKTFKQQNVKPISYSVVKHGLIGITKYFSTYDTKRLRCNAIAFGGVKVNDKKFEKRVSELIPLNRMANAEEYITTMQYLLSPKSTYVNGSTLVVDGGRTII